MLGCVPKVAGGIIAARAVPGAGQLVVTDGVLPDDALTRVGRLNALADTYGLTRMNRKAKQKPSIRIEKERDRRMLFSPHLKRFFTKVYSSIIEEILILSTYQYYMQ
jgi:hypothetical protein